MTTNATITFLYSEGYEDELIPNRPFVSLRKWSHDAFVTMSRHTDYIMDYGIWGEPEGIEDELGPWKQWPTTKFEGCYLFDKDTPESEIIRIAIAKYDTLKEECNDE